MNSNFKLSLQNIPHLPGCYIYYNIHNQVIYVGKAKNLYKRVNSYFERFQSLKTDELVKNINRFDFIVTNTEKESLLLEINLIQKHKPKYNILLKDGRNYPYIRISSDKHPKIDYVLNKSDDKIGGTYYGPFPDAKTARLLVEIINKTFMFRKCKTIPERKCLYYDMKLCYGPCINLLSENIYDFELSLINDFFKSKPAHLINFLKQKMGDFSQNLDFEQAMQYRDSLAFIQEFIAKQIVEIPNQKSFDIISIRGENNVFGMYTLMIRGGMILAHDFISGSENTIEEYLINRYFEQDISVYVDNLNFYKKISEGIKSLKIAKVGIYLELMSMATKNLKIQLEKELLEVTKQKQIDKFFTNELNITKYHNIFMLDISHLGGDYNVGGLVCFSDNVKNKKLYRHYKLSNNVNDDAGSIGEVMHRICNNQNLVEQIDVFIVDGGIGQKNIVEKIARSYNCNFKVLALEKNNKHITHELLIDQRVIVLDNPILLRYFAKIQDEVHRFANNYMQKTNFKSKTKSIFSAIKGVGPKRVLLLEANFNTLDDLLGASIDDLEKIGFSTSLAIQILEAVGELV